MESLISLSPVFTAAVLFGIMLLLLAIGMEISFAMGVTGILAILLFLTVEPSKIIPSITWNKASVFELASLAMFILTGAILINTRLSDWLYEGLAPWVTWLPGRLFHTTILGCTAFAGISGSSVATTTTIGSVTYHQLAKRGYDPHLAAGSLAGAGTLGLLIPPSIVPLIYASVVDVSVGKLFMAGLVPGLVLAGLFSLSIVIQVKLQPSKVPTVVERFNWRERRRGLVLMSPTIGLMAVVLGTLYAGFATPTEVAAIGVVGAILIAAVTKSLRGKQFLTALKETCRTTSFILFLVVGSSWLATALAYLGIPRLIAEALLSLSGDANVILILLTILYLVLGMLLDPNSMLLLTLPVIMPTVDALGIDRIWFGVYLVLMTELSNVTPPVGFNLFVIQSMTKLDIYKISRAAIPSAAAMLLTVVLIRVWPSLALWLPATMSHR